MKKALRWVGTVFGLLAFVFLVLIGIGTSLPVKHSATCSADLAAPVSTVWRTAANPLDASWRSDVARVEASPGVPGTNFEWTEVDRYGHAIKYERVSQNPDDYIVNRIADPSLPFSGQWTYRFSRAPGGSRLTLVEDGEIYNPIFRLVSRYVVGYTSTMHQYLTDLGKHFGTAPSVDCATTL